jgi:hypothetical protein
MSDFNASPFTKAQWDKLAARCEKDTELKQVWKVFAALYNGNAKTAIETLDKWIKFTEVSVNVVTEGESFEEDTDLPVGEPVNDIGRMKAAAKKMLSSKDDKTAERINVMLKSYTENIKEREKLIQELSPEDAAEAGRSRLMIVAEQRGA